MKKAYLVSYGQNGLVDVREVKIAIDFEYGIDSIYGDKVPFPVGSNQTIVEELTEKQLDFLNSKE
jgi:hypothetical protein